MFGSKKSAETRKVDTLIGRGTVISGNLKAKGIVRIDGTYEGDVFTEGDVVVGEDARVKAHINCENVVIAGNVEGNIEAKNKVDIRSSGAIWGDIKAAALVVEDGALFTGKSVMERKEKEAKGSLQDTGKETKDKETNEKDVDRKKGSEGGKIPEGKEKEARGKEGKEKPGQKDRARESGKSAAGTGATAG